MGEEMTFFAVIGALLWIGWPLWEIANHMKALREKAGA